MQSWPNTVSGVHRRSLADNADRDQTTTDLAFGAFPTGTSNGAPNGIDHLDHLKEEAGSEPSVG